MKVLLAVDGSVYTQRMLDYLAAHKDFLGPTHDYTALTVITPVPPHVSGHVSRSVLDQHYAEEAEQALKSAKTFIQQQGWNVTTLHRQGSPAEVIAETAEAGKFELLVMGSHGHSALGSLMLGSVTARVMVQSSVPLLISR
ncbi:MAG TPA: universal stress protein [Rhizobacter sp.]|nr:universal stress protein [Rhizobacter sp.]